MLFFFLAILSKGETNLEYHRIWKFIIAYGNCSRISALTEMLKDESPNKLVDILWPPGGLDCPTCCRWLCTRVRRTLAAAKSECVVRVATTAKL